MGIGPLLLRVIWSFRNNSIPKRQCAASTIRRAAGSPNVYRKFRESKSQVWSLRACLGCGTKLLHSPTPTTDALCQFVNSSIGSVPPLRLRSRIQLVWHGRVLRSCAAEVVGCRDTIVRGMLKTLVLTSYLQV